ncbi:MAG: hypothetical protein LBM95_01695 [Lactobacillales bacterium]|jgi:uncharacterized protein with HEPN domain|nr:hypothetical protein [Lactobacillales bacterium]
MDRVERDLSYIDSMLENARNTEKDKVRLLKLGVPLNDEMTIRLFSFSLAQIGEQAVLNKISEETFKAFPEFPWADINAFRNYINHDYGEIRPKIY